MDKYIGLLSAVPNGFLHVAKSFATDNSSPKIEPAHILRALLHKSAGLADFIENRLDSDYYYLLDWADIRMGQCPRSAYPMKEPVCSDAAKSVVKEARRIADSLGMADIDARCLLAAVVSPGVGFTADQLKTMPLSADEVVKGVSGSRPVQDATGNGVLKATASSGGEEDWLVDLFGELPELPVIGFDSQLRSMIETLSRRDRANMIVSGESGVGKTSLLLGLVKRVKEGSVPSSLKDLSPMELDIISMTQGVSYKGEVEDRFKAVAERLARLPHPLLVVENFHRVMDRQSLLNGLLPMFKKLLSRNRLQVVLTTTVDGFTKEMEKDKELLSFCETVALDEPAEDVAVEILKSKLPVYSEFHKVGVADDVAESIVRLARRYMPEKSLPSSAIDLLDRALASAKVKAEMEEGSGPEAVVDKDCLKDVVAGMTGLPVGNVQSEERSRLANAEEILRRRVVGQDHAVKSILDAIYESRSGLNKKGQPMGSFFFLGPTGTGKTELAKALAEFLFKDESSILRFDMSEYKEEHSVALLYGAPPGYVGYEEGGLLVNQIRRHPYSVVLFDEIEKAHRSVFDLFLQILDEGKLHDRLGRVGDFSNALIIFTSNIGSEHIFRSFEAGRIPTHDEMLEVMHGQFRPEFLARLTEILPFSPITSEMVYKIFDIHVRNLVRSLDNQDIRLEIDESAKGYITQTGFNTRYGARPVLGIIRKEIRRPLSKMVISGDLAAGDTVVMKYDAGRKEMVWEIDTSA